MEKVQINLEDLIGNAMIEIYKKDQRRIVDIKDIKNYQNLITKELKKLRMEPKFFCDRNNLYQSLSKYFFIFNGNNYIMLPWISIEDLTKRYRNNMQLKFCRCFCNNVVKNGLLNRTKEELSRFNKINQAVINTYVNQLVVTNDDSKIEKIKKINNIRKNKS